MSSFSPAGGPRARDLERKPHIGIIGGGLSGLRCADVLLQHGFKVTVVEGRHRLGGRMHQETLPTGHLVDMGPNWIHGTKDNPILDLAKQTETIHGSWDSTTIVFDQHGKLLPLNVGEECWSIMWDIVQSGMKHSNKYSNEIDPGENLYDYFQREVVKAIPNTEESWQEKREIVMQMAELWGAFVGGPVKSQSLKFFWMEECIEGENLFCAGTFQKVLEVMTKPVTEGATILYGRAARSIQRRSEASEAVNVVTSTGETLEFDEVVLTAPLGWLKRNLSAFVPPLPPRLRQAIESLGYGCLEKVYISFPKAFWLVPDEEGRSVHGFCQWLLPDYATDTNPERWTQEVVDLASLSPSTSHPTLLFYFYGDQSRAITDALAGLPSMAEKDGYLCNFFKPYYSRLPHYDAESTDCQPAGCIATDWLHDDLAGNGSYTNFQVGLEEGDKDVRTMREGLPDQGLWLAGEHTAPILALGTATGAYWSGESVARRIAEAYGRASEGSLARMHKMPQDGGLDESKA